jgi:gluconolactonase
MFRFHLLYFLVFAILLSCTTNGKKIEQNSTQEENKTNFQTLGSIEIYDQFLNSLIDSTGKIEILADGYKWVEGPVWIADGGYLLFSDVFHNTIYKWKEGDSVSVYLKPAGYTGETARGGELGSNGLFLNQSGELLICQHGNRQVAKMNAPLSAPSANFITLAGAFEGERLNSPNDLVVRSNGDVYFTDPPYGLEKQMNDSSKALDFQGVYRVSESGGVQLMSKDIDRPNGIAFSPDESKAYVSNTDPSNAIWTVFDVDQDGIFTNAKVFFDATKYAKELPGLPDGMAVHRATGMLFATGPGGVFILSKDGELLGKIQTGERTANCTFDDLQQNLYITANSFILRVKMKS